MKKIAENTYRKEVKRSWWYRWLRGMNYFAFRYWWLILLFFVLFLVAWFFLCYEPCTQCENYNEEKDLIERTYDALDDCCNCDDENFTENEVSDSISDATDHLRDSLGGDTGAITITLTWQTYDDLDLHLVEPSGNRIYFDNKVSPSGGALDVDINAEGGSMTSNALENIYYKGVPPSGQYTVYVHFYERVTTQSSIPYQVYVTLDGKTRTFSGTHSTKGKMNTIHTFNYPQ
ncbi:MAG: hypothetical protein C0592_00545 [Marinilabiliales bacterium]|nr:MAG: hypothetical protein C0592_00545 [Marinilabiliales bacterium]